MLINDLSSGSTSSEVVSEHFLVAHLLRYVKSTPNWTVPLCKLGFSIIYGSDKPALLKDHTDALFLNSDLVWLASKPNVVIMFLFLHFFASCLVGTECPATRNVCLHCKL